MLFNDSATAGGGFDNETVDRYEDFLESVLREDLRKIHKEIEDLRKLLSALDKLKVNLSFLLEQEVSELDSLVNVGSDAYMNAHVPDTSNVFIDIGEGFFLEMPLKEALDFIPQRKTVLLRRLSFLQDKCARMQAQVQVFTEALAAILSVQ